MCQEQYLDAVHNNTIRFSTFRPAGSQFALLDRNIKLVGPDAVLRLVHAPRITLLPALIELLQDSSRAWAAAVILTALTRSNAKIIESFANDSAGWWETIGINAYQKWDDWYRKNKNNIEWNDADKIFEMSE